MRLGLLLIALMTQAIAAVSQPVSTIRTPDVTYVLKMQSHAPEPSNPEAERRYVLQAFRAGEVRPRWTADVEPEARELYLVSPVLLTSSCFSGAYLSCTVQAFATGTGRELWKASGRLGKINPDFVLLWDDFFVSDDGPDLSVKLRVIRLREGTLKRYALKVSPRGGCEGPVELLSVTAFSTSRVVVSLRDSCGLHTRTFR